MPSKVKIPTLRTFTGKIIDLTKPITLDLIDIRDIAHGLSNVCRYSGQCPRFFSVAAHSLMVSFWIEKQAPHMPHLALEGLLHDASEAYLQDLPSPVKRLCPDYKRLERKFMKKIFKRFELSEGKLRGIIKHGDEEVLKFEKEFLLDFERPDRPVGAWYFKRDLSDMFLKRFYELKRQIAEEK